MSIVIENIAKLGVIQLTMKMMKLTIPKQKTFLMMKLQLLIIILKENSQKLSIIKTKITAQFDPDIHQ